MSTKKTELKPPDMERCQTIHQTTFMTMGGPPAGTPIGRCDRKPKWIAKETKPASDSQRGSMSVCGSCKKILIGQLGEDFATFKKIKN